MAPIWYWVSPIWSDLPRFGPIWSDLVIRVTVRIAVTQGRRIGGMSHRAACGWTHIHVDSGPVALCGPVALYLLQ